MTPDLILLIAAVIVCGVVFTWLIKVVKATISTALTIALLLFVLSILGIGPDKLLQKLSQIPQFIWNSVTTGQ